MTRSDSADDGPDAYVNDFPAMTNGAGAALRPTRYTGANRSCADASASTRDQYDRQQLAVLSALVLVGKVRAFRMSRRTERRDRRKHAAREKSRSHPQTATDRLTNIGAE